MRTTVRLSLLLIHCAELRITCATIRHALSYRLRGKLVLYQHTLRDARKHAACARDILHQWLLLMRCYQSR